jgi:hypothetical protein
MQQPLVCHQCGRVGHQRLCPHETCHVQICSTQCFQDHQFTCDAQLVPSAFQVYEKEHVVDFSDATMLTEDQLEKAVQNKIPAVDYAHMRILQVLWPAIVRACDDIKLGRPVSEPRDTAGFFRKRATVTLQLARVDPITSKDVWKYQCTTPIANAGALLFVVKGWIEKVLNDTNTVRARKTLAALTQLTPTMQLVQYKWTVRVRLRGSQSAKINVETPMTSTMLELYKNVNLSVYRGNESPPTDRSAIYTLRLDTLHPPLALSDEVDRLRFEKSLAFVIVVLLRAMGLDAQFMIMVKLAESVRHGLTVRDQVKQILPAYRLRDPEKLYTVNIEDEAFGFRQLVWDNDVRAISQKISSIDIEFLPLTKLITSPRPLPPLPVSGGRSFL